MRGLGLPEDKAVLIGIRPHDLKPVSEGGQGLPVQANLTEHLARSNFAVCRPASSTDYLHERGAIQFEADAA